MLLEVAPYSCLRFFSAEDLQRIFTRIGHDLAVVWNNLIDLGAYLTASIIYLIESGIFCILSAVFYAGYETFSQEETQKRTARLVEDHNAVQLDFRSERGEKVDALYLPSRAEMRTGNAIVLALNTSYQSQKPKHFVHYLNNGADVVLFNPTALCGRQMERDLTSLLHLLRSRNPHQKIVVKSYCASSDPCIAAVASMRDASISLIIDRGYGDIVALARSFTVFAALPIVQRVIQRDFSCDGISKIGGIPGDVLFVAPKPDEDQLMHLGRGDNLTYQLFNKRGSGAFLEFTQSDHWTKWGPTICNAINLHLNRMGILMQNYQLVTPEIVREPELPSCCSRNVLPFLIKAWC